jgi:hypothetical protein
MRRLSDARRADALLERGSLSRTMLEAIARRIAMFHEEARHDDETARLGRPDAIASNVQENFEQTRDTIRKFLSSEELDEIERRQMTELRERRAIFDARADEGYVRDGHGDLRLEHVYIQGSLDGDPAPGASLADATTDLAHVEQGEQQGDRGGNIVVIDCIEFNERFRFADVCADIAFLSMDLCFHGRTDLAEHFLAAYARESGDYDLYRVVDFYESYRAYVRGKVAVMLASDEHAAWPARKKASEQARRYFLLSLASERKSLMNPSVIAVGGIIASGKSTMADALSSPLQAPVVSTDRTRKQLLGADATVNVARGAWSGAYDPGFTERVYEEAFRRAEAVLSSGRTVILDASFRSRDLRGRAKRLAEHHQVPFRFVECRVARETAEGRLAEREERRAEVSDARLDLLDDFIASWEPVQELAPAEHVLVDGGRPVREGLARVEQTLPFWPPGLTA